MASILALLLTTLIGFALFSVGRNARAITTNDRENTEAFFVAEAGMTHALQVIRSLGQANFTKILRNGNDAVLFDELANGDEITTIADPIGPGGVSLPDIPGNNYRVSVRDDVSASLNDTNGRLIVQSVGVGRNNATATIEVLFGSLPMPGMIVDGQLRINGNPIFAGVGGSVHSNGTLDFDGNPCAHQYFSSASNIIDPGHAATGPGCNGSNVFPSQPLIPVPDYVISNWATDPAVPDPDMIFRPDGTIWKKNTAPWTDPRAAIAAHAGLPAGYTAYRGVPGSPCASSCSGDFTEINGSGTALQRWAFDGDGNKKLWALGGDSMVGGRTYYSSGGSLSISGNPGDPSTPAVVTLLADGYIDISGNPRLAPKDANVQMMVGTDLKISGNPGGSGFNFRGLHYARHQIGFSGNPAISGQVMAKNLGDTHFPATPTASCPTCGQNIIPLSSGFMEISGNPTITYDGGSSSSSRRALNWREIRN